MSTKAVCNPPKEILCRNYEERRQHQRYSAETVYAAISTASAGRGFFGSPLVPIDISEQGLSFLSDLDLDRKQRAHIVLAGYGVISGHIEVTVERKQRLREDLYRYGVSVADLGQGKRGYNAILAHCAKQGSSRAAWKE